MPKNFKHQNSRDYSEIKRTHLPKTIYFHLEDDADVVDWLQNRAKPNASEAVRRIMRHYISTGQDDLPANPTAAAATAAVDPASIRQAVAEAMAEAMGDIRAIVQAAVDTALAGRVINAGDITGRPAAGLLNGNGNGNGRAAAALEKLALALDEDDI